MNKFETNKITKSDFLKLNEEDLMFITNPGRMGDEDGSTFIIKKENISLDEALNQFPKWRKTWKESDKKEYNKKYKYLYMGFGNGLSIDNSIYTEFEPYLNKLVEEYLENKSDEEKISLKYAAIYASWEKAFINMVNDKE